MAETKTSASTYLKSLLNRTLRITTTDTRMFLGEFKCTDSVGPPHPLPLLHSSLPPSLHNPSISRPLKSPHHKQTNNTPSQDRNIILAHTYEYRLPSTTSKITATTKDGVIKNMTSRYLGLVVVPGESVVRIELEEFSSQVKAREEGQAGPAGGVVA